MQFFKLVTRKKNEMLRALKLKILLSSYILKSEERNLIKERVKHVLILRLDDKVGDMIVATGLIKAFHENNIKVSVLTGSVCHELLSSSPLIHKCYLYKRRGKLIELDEEGIDLVIDFDDVVTFERCKLISRFSYAHVIGFNKDNFPMYHTSLTQLDENSHITERHKLVIRTLQLTSEKYTYFLPECLDAKEKVSNVLHGSTYSRFIAINPLTGSDDKDFSIEQTQFIVNHIKKYDEKILLILVGQPSKLFSMGIKNVVMIPDSTISVAVEIIRRCDAVISPDTSIIHMANAFNKPLLAIYNKRKLKDTGLVGYNLWSPNYPNANQVVFEERNINEVPISSIISLIDKILEPHTSVKNDIEPILTLS
ncbi:glycosyltransferase family 9 protein [Erwinia sp. P7711]|uniref:glycosyltransferase family 9 protein n=1 Tax=Erwinia sp. P7711 TaxID=3141451 RepID=UPI00318A8B79